MPRERATRRVALSLNTDNGANQEDMAGADINVIVGQYKRTGTLPAVQLTNPLYGDFTDSEDLMDVREQHYLAAERFNELPADVRTAADNDWVKFLQMFNDPEQRELLETSGLVISTDPAIDPPPTPDPAAEPAPASPPTGPDPVTT